MDSTNASALEASSREPYREKPDGRLDPAGETGWFLQRERERRGLSLAAVARVCGIHSHHLEAIEFGDLTRLPARDEALGMISVYANALGFDPQPLVRHYTRFLPQAKQVTLRAVQRPRPLGSAKIISFPFSERMRDLATGAGGVVASVCAAVLLFGGLAWMAMPGGTESDRTRVAASQGARTGIATEEKVATTAEEETGERRVVSSISRIVEEPLGKSGTTASQSALAAAADRSANGLSGIDTLIERNFSSVPLPKPKPKRRVASANDSLAFTDIDSVSEPPKVVASSKKSPPPNVSETVRIGDKGRVFGAKNLKARLVLKAKANIWVRIEDTDGNVVLTQTLLKGDSYRVPARDGLILIARDGGLLSYSVDGVDKGSLGKTGEILVGRSLNIGDLASKG